MVEVEKSIVYRVGLEQFDSQADADSFARRENDAIWALRATTECSKKIHQKIAVFCAEESLHIYEKNIQMIAECEIALRRLKNTLIMKLNLVSY